MLDDQECFEETKEEFRSALRGCGLVVDDDEQLFQYYKAVHNISKAIAQIVATWSQLFQQVVEVFQEVSRQLSGSAIEVLDFKKTIEELEALFTEVQAKESHKPRVYPKGKKISYTTARLRECNRVYDQRAVIRKRHYKCTPRAPPFITPLRIDFNPPISRLPVGIWVNPFPSPPPALETIIGGLLKRKIFVAT